MHEVGVIEKVINKSGRTIDVICMSMIGVLENVMAKVRGH